MSPLFTQIYDEIHGAWRFRWYALAAAWAVCVAGWLVVFTMQDMYEASARVFVDTRTALRPLLQGLAVDSDVDSQLKLVREGMLGRPQLERVARETDLDLQAETPQARAEMIDTLRSRIVITGGPNASNPQVSGGLFVISYQDPSRDKSVEVVDKLLNTFVEDTLGGKRQGSETAQKFLRGQIEDYERRLSEAEQRLADFKKRNVGLMPGEQGGDYFSRLQNEMDAVKKAQAALGVAMSRRDEMQRQLRGETPFIASGAAVANSGNKSSGGDTASRIQETQARLDELLLRFTDKHPDVVAARENLVQLKERQQAEIEALRRGDPTAVAAAGAATNPVYQSIQLQLNQTEVEIAALRGEIGDRQQKVAQLRQLVDTVPEVEAEFARLNRDYDVTRAQYTALVERLEKARLGEQAEETGVVKFEIVDPPSAAYIPVAPNRPRLLLLVLVVGLAVAGGLAYLLHQMRPVFNNARVLNEITGLQVLGAVSMTWLDRHKQASRRRQLVFGGVAAMLLVLFVGVMVFQSAGARLMHRLVS
jgi:polysaccharide chain length determinant protein (PEP-CTERM system associated)